MAVAVSGSLQPVPPSMMHQEQARVMGDPGLSSVFVNPATGDIWQEGDIYTFPLLGRTLRKSDIETTSLIS